MKFEIYNKKTGEVIIVSEMEEWLTISDGKIKYANGVWSMEDYGVRFY